MLQCSVTAYERTSYEAGSDIYTMHVHVECGSGCHEPSRAFPSRAKRGPLRGAQPDVMRQESHMYSVEVV